MELCIVRTASIHSKAGGTHEHIINSDVYHLYNDSMLSWSAYPDQLLAPHVAVRLHNGDLPYAHYEHDLRPRELSPYDGD